jgi:hypothetical protein
LKQNDLIRTAHESNIRQIYRICYK